MNFIKTLEIGERLDPVFALALKGQYLFQVAKKRLWVVADVSEEAEPDTLPMARHVFESHDGKFYSAGEMDQLCEEIRKTAHAPENPAG
jgi:hypothetical protein